MIKKSQVRTNLSYVGEGNNAKCFMDIDPKTNRKVLYKIYNNPGRFNSRIVKHLISLSGKTNLMNLPTKLLRHGFTIIGYTCPYTDGEALDQFISRKHNIPYIENDDINTEQFISMYNNLMETADFLGSHHIEINDFHISNIIISKDSLSLIDPDDYIYNPKTDKDTIIRGNKFIIQETLKESFLYLHGRRLFNCLNSFSSDISFFKLINEIWSEHKLQDGNIIDIERFINDVKSRTNSTYDKHR